MRGRTFACSDLHGCYDLYRQIKSYLQPYDKVFFLGDAGDRGPDSWKTIKAIIDDEQFYYLKGNHEQMLIDAYYNRTPLSKSALYRNGGRATLAELMIDKEKGVDVERYLSCLKHLPLSMAHVRPDGTIAYLSHAGFSPNIDETPDLLWDRLHIYDKWDESYNNEYIIHGHTPIYFILTDEVMRTYDTLQLGPSKRILYYANGHKIDIDNGVYDSGRIALLDLDTFEEIEFDTDIV